MAENLASWTAVDTAEAVRSGKASPVEVVEACLERISRLDPAVGAFHLVRAERALDEARRLAGRPDELKTLPLAGVPVAIKDNVDLEGEPTRDGSLATPAGPRPADHEVVRRIRAAGGIVVGKTRVPELCVFGATDSPFGIARNPWNLDRTPGGSSGGSAAAVAAGMVPVAHGNDGMGSIRIPSACCGVFGIKPGFGIVPAGLGPTSWRGLAENGSIAATVADAALLLSVMAGRPAFARPAPPERRLRIAVSTKPPMMGIAVDRAFKDAARGAARVLAEAGHDVVETPVPYATRFGLAAIGWWVAGTDDDAEGLDRTRLQPSIRRHAALGAGVKRRGWARPEQRVAWRARLAPFFERFDLVVTPALARPPIRSIAWGRRSWLANMLANAGYAPFAQPWNLAGYPAASIPFGTHPRGTPLAVQLAAPEGGELLLLAVARLLEERRPWPRRAPIAEG